MKFTTGSGGKKGYVGGSYRKCLWGLLKIEATSFSSSCSLGVSLLFCFFGSKRYAFIYEFFIMYLFTAGGGVGVVVAGIGVAGAGGVVSFSFGVVSLVFLIFFFSPLVGFWSLKLRELID